MIPNKYANRFIPVKYFLTSYRALSDGIRGIDQLEERLQSSTILLSDWKVTWIGACTLLRTSIDLFQIDAKSCISLEIREALKAEWKSIKDSKLDHPIFWEFLQKERNNIIHEYEWAAYEAWMNNDGITRPANMSLLDLKQEDSRSVLIMRGGFYKDRDSLQLLRESAGWVEERIFSAIIKAGFSPDENRSIVSFAKPENIRKGLLSS